MSRDRRVFRSAGEGKLVDTWIYAYKGIEQPGDEDAEDHEKQPKLVRDMKVEVELRLDKTTDELDNPPHALRQIEFLVICRAPYIRFKGTDIEALRKAVWEKLDEQFQIKWERYYKVQITQARIYDGIGAAMEFSYHDVEKGTAHDGTLLLREYQTYRSEYKVAPWPGSFKDERGKVIACIPDTKANRQALEEYAKRLNALREKLAETLRPEVILQTLANLNRLALPPPAKEKEDHHADD
jgi:hypothetical protein